MIVKLKRKFKKSFRHFLKNRIAVLIVLVLVSCSAAIGYAQYMQNRWLTVDPKTYTALLGLIAKAESNGNYNAYFGNASNNSIDFTTMTLAQVMAWQAAYLQKGNTSSAVGRYQFLNTTLDGLVRRLNLDPHQKFDATLQDRLAIALLERRGAEQYVNKKLTRDQFAANLAKEWASLPKVTQPNPSDSYYVSDGLNKSRVSVAQVQQAIDPIQPDR